MSDSSEMRIIDGLEVKVFYFSSITSMRLIHKISKVLAPTLGGTLGGVLGNVKGDIDSLDITDSKLNGDSVVSAINNIFEVLPEDDFINLVQMLLKDTYINIKENEKTVSIKLENQVAIDRVFKGSITKMFKVLAFVFEVNFADFLQQAKGGIGNLIGKIST